MRVTFTCTAPPVAKLLPFVVVEARRDGQLVLTSDALASDAQVDAFFEKAVAELSIESTDEPREQAKRELAQLLAARGWQADDEPLPELQGDEQESGSSATP